MSDAWYSTIWMYWGTGPPVSMEPIPEASSHEPTWSIADAHTSRIRVAERSGISDLCHPDAMSLSIASITFDSTNPEPLARWWAERFGAEIVANMDGFFLIVAGGSLDAQLAFQKVEDPTPGKNKVHIDIRTDDDLDAEAARWVDAGATSLGKRNAGDFHWVTLADPDGNEFCIAGA